MGKNYIPLQVLTAADANGFAQLTDLAAGTGATLVGAPTGTVQGDLTARPTSANLAASGGASLVGTTTGTVQTDLTARPTSASLAASGGAGLVGLPGSSGGPYTLSALVNDFTQNQSVTSGSVMWVDHALENSSFLLKNEGGIWSGNTYTYFGVSKEMTSGTVSGGGSGPLTSLFAFANNNGSSGDVVAVLGDSVARQSSGSVFGANFIARNVAGTTNTKLVGLELDVEPATGTTDAVGSIGLALNIFSIASNATVVLVAGVGGGTWANGFGTSHIRGAHYYVNSGDPTTASSFISTINGTFSNGAIQLGQGAAQSVNFGGGSFGVSPYLYGDSGGNLQLNMGTGGFFEINNPAGAQRFTFDQYGGLNMPNNGVIKINSVQVLAQQITGYGTPTGNVKTANFPGATATLLQTSEMLAQLIIDLKSHGLIGA